MQTCLCRSRFSASGKRWAMGRPTRPSFITAALTQTDARGALGGFGIVPAGLKGVAHRARTDARNCGARCSVGG